MPARALMEVKTMSREDWAILRGGPKDGWVIDTSSLDEGRRLKGGVEIFYAPTERYEQHPEDGAPVRVYQWVNVTRPKEHTPAAFRSWRDSLTDDQLEWLQAKARWEQKSLMAIAFEWGVPIDVL